MAGRASDGARLAALWVYPFKSAAGIAVDATDVDPVGLRHDRRWMIVDAAGRFVSQRTHPRMALVRATFEDGALRVAAPGAGTIALPLAAGEGPSASAEGPPAPFTIRVWHEDRYAADCGEAAANWASAFLGGAGYRVVRAVAPAGKAPLGPTGMVRAGFADAEPALAISTASLDELNRRLARPLPMDRFRPNLVVAGVEPHAEDAWGRVRVGDVVIRGERPCARCTIPTVDQVTGRVAGKEPLTTLARYRRLPDGEVGFGMNVRFENAGVLRVGDAVEALANV